MNHLIHPVIRFIHDSNINPTDWISCKIIENNKKLIKIYSRVLNIQLKLNILINLPLIKLVIIK